MEGSLVNPESATSTPSRTLTSIVLIYHPYLPPITFIDRDFKGINPVNQDDPMVVSIAIANFMVSKILID